MHGRYFDARFWDARYWLASGAVITTTPIASDRTISWDVEPSANRIAWALTGRYGPVSYGFRYELRTIGYQFLEDVTLAVISSGISLNNDRDVAWRLDLQLDPAALDDAGQPVTIDPLRDVVAVHMDLLVDGEFSQSLPLGLYVLVRPLTSYSPAGAIQSVEGYDPSWLLANATTTTTYSVASGTNYVTAMAAVVAACNAEIRHAFPTTTKTTPIAMSWPAGTAWIRILGELAAGINHYLPYADAEGVIRTRESQDLHLRTADVTYRDDEFVLDQQLEEDQADIWINQVVAVVDDPARGVLSAVRTNADPSSPISTVVTGRTLTRVVEADRAADQATLNAIAEQMLRDAAGQLTHAKLTTSLDPRRGNHEVYDLEVEGVYDGVKWWARNWTMSCVIGGRMTHDISRTASPAVS